MHCGTVRPGAVRFEHIEDPRAASGSELPWRLGTDVCVSYGVGKSETLSYMGLIRLLQFSHTLPQPGSNVLALQTPGRLKLPTSS